MMVPALVRPATEAGATARGQRGRRQTQQHEACSKQMTARSTLPQSPPSARQAVQQHTPLTVAKNPAIARMFWCEGGLCGVADVVGAGVVRAGAPHRRTSARASSKSDTHNLENWAAARELSRLSLLSRLERARSRARGLLSRLCPLAVIRCQRPSSSTARTKSVRRQAESARLLYIGSPTSKTVAVRFQRSDPMIVRHSPSRPYPGPTPDRWSLLRPASVNRDDQD